MDQKQRPGKSGDIAGDQMADPVDEASEESMDASDPPAFSPTTAGAGDHELDEAEIRRRAHEIWEQEGRPDGRDADHWERARAELRGGRGG